MNNGRVGGDIVSGGSVTVHTAQPDHPSMWDDSNPILTYNVQSIQWQPNPNVQCTMYNGNPILTKILIDGASSPPLRSSLPFRRIIGIPRWWYVSKFNIKWVRLKSKWKRVKVICVSGETSLNLTWALLMTGWAAFGHLYVTHERGAGKGALTGAVFFFILGLK